MSNVAEFPLVQIDSALIASAIHRSRNSPLSFWDALIVQAAIEGHASTLYSEDMQALVRPYGTGHHLAFPHVAFWSPLLVYLFLQRRRLLKKTPFGIWAVLLFATDGASLLLDYRAVFIWMALE